MVETAWVYTISSPYVLRLLAYCSGQTPVSESGGCLLPFYSFLRPFSYYWIASPSLDVRVCAWSYCILLGPWEACFFLGDKGKWEKSGGGGTWKMEGGEAVVWMYYMKEEKKLIFFKEIMQTFLCSPQQNLLLLSSKFYVLF